MRVKPLLLILLLAAFHLLHPAHAIDPGVAQGFVQTGSDTVALTHAYVQLDGPKTLHILLADRAVPQSVLDRAAADAMHMAREGRLRGFLIRVDPQSPRHAAITLLDRRAKTPRPLVTRTVSGNRDAVRNLKIANNRVSGETDSADAPAGLREKVVYRVSFSAPLFTEPAISAKAK